MAESLGGSRGRNSTLNSTKLAAARNPGLDGTRKDMGGTAKGAGILGGTFGGGGGGRQLSARGPPGGGAMFMTAPGRARPLSAPRERPMGGSAGPGMGGGGGGFGGMKGGPTLDARARVEELRQVKEAQFWGRQPPPKRDLPAFWSVATYGQPFNDERLASGSTNYYQILDPAGLHNPEHAAVGPATEQAAAIRKSLTQGVQMLDPKNLSPRKGVDPKSAARLDEAERLFLLNKMTPYQRIHALRNCLDRDQQGADFTPWTELVNRDLNAAHWRRNRETCIRLAVQKLENMMKRHLQFLSNQINTMARAPAKQPKLILKEAFWKVDPGRTLTVSTMQFLQVWQNVLCLLEYDDEHVQPPGGKPRVNLKPKGRFIMDANMACAIFVKYGFDKDGLMPYVVFINAITSSPARLLGHELILDKKAEGKHGLSNEVDVAHCVADAKILYQKCEMGVFPPSGFDHRVALRSKMLPTAHMYLEHVYGYSGFCYGASDNVWYTHNTKNYNEVEFVYFTGMVGVVFNKAAFDRNEPCQRFFFGHDNDIQCIAIHPNRRWVATGQQKREDDEAGVEFYPYVCIWDVDNCNQLQRLEHGRNERSVICCCFSGDPWAVEPHRVGGDLLITVTSDDRHSIHVWRWMVPADKYCKALCIPGWCFGPEKKLKDLEAEGLFYDNPEKRDLYGDVKPWLQPVDQSLVDAELDNPKHPLVVETLKGLWQDGVAPPPDKRRYLNPRFERGFCTEPPRCPGSGPEGVNEGLVELDDKTAVKVANMPGSNGTPPMVYGVIYNPYRPQDGRRGSEFCTFGVKHLKTWIVNESDRWEEAMGTFGTDHIENIYAATYIPAMHNMAAPGDSCILTGFSKGDIGLWIPPYPTKAGQAYQLTRKFPAHEPGRVIPLIDGTQSYAGVRSLRLRPTPSGDHDNPGGLEVLSGGADGFVRRWAVLPVTGTRPDGTPLRGCKLQALPGPTEERGYRLAIPSAPFEAADPPRCIAVDCHPNLDKEFVVGTDTCDIWEVDKDPRRLVEGAEEDLYKVTMHPTDPNIFATTCQSGRVRVYDISERDVVRSAMVGFPLSAVDFSKEEYPLPNGGKGLHLAVGSFGSYQLGKWHRVGILDAQTLQPLHILMHPAGQVDEIQYSPAHGPATLAAGSNDMKIYLYNVRKGYQLIATCTGHSGVLECIDWSLPISLPGNRLHGKMILQSTDASLNILYWDAETGKKIPYSQRDAQWSHWTCKLGFPVMGIWPDGSDRTDINAVDRAGRGTATLDMEEVAAGEHLADCVDMAKEEDSADGVPGCGYLVSSDDFSTVRLFNFPVVWDDAPFRMYRGHGSHVMCCRFSCDDRRVITIGGHDRGIYQWRTVGVRQEDWERDRVVLAAWQEAIDRVESGTSAHKAQPGVEWGALDDQGKMFGPLAKPAPVPGKPKTASFTGGAGVPPTPGRVSGQHPPPSPAAYAKPL